MSAFAAGVLTGAGLLALALVLVATRARWVRRRELEDAFRRAYEPRGDGDRERLRFPGRRW